MAYRELESITLDLSQVELDLRMALHSGIQFEGLGKLILIGTVRGKIEYGFCSEFGKRKHLRYHQVKKIQLSTDWLKSVGVEVEE